MRNMLGWTVILLTALVWMVPGDIRAFGGGVNQGSSSNNITKLNKKQARLLGQLGHGALVKQIKKEKKPKAIRALMAKALKILKDHEAKKKAEVQKAAKANKGKKKGAFGK